MFAELEETFPDIELEELLLEPLTLEEEELLPELLVPEGELPPELLAPEGELLPEPLTLEDELPDELELENSFPISISSGNLNEQETTV
jgi:hypothetical protein